MLKVTYRERNYIGGYKVIDYERKFFAEDCFKPEGTSLYYFRTDRYNIKTIPEEDLVSVFDMQKEEYVFGKDKEDEEIEKIER